MATDISSTRSVNDLTAGINKLGDLKKAGEDQIRDLFDDNYFNGGQKARNDIDAQIKDIEDQIKEWEKKLNDYQKEMDNIEKKIDGVSGDLADATGKYVSAQTQYEAELQTAINKAIVRAVNNTKSKNRAHEGATSFKIEFQTELGKLMDNAALANISAIYNETGELKGELGGLCDQLNGFITDSNNAMKGLKNAQAVINLLNQTKDNMTAQQNNYYANVNNDAKVPVFTYEKEAYIAELANDYGINLGDRADNKITNGASGVKNDAEIANITNQINELGKASTGSGDKYAAGSDNDLMKNLGKALFGDNPNATTVQEGSLVWQLAENGASNTEIMDILANAFGGLGITKNGNNNYTIPYGHGTADERAAAGRTIVGRGAEIFSAVMSIANNTSGMPEPASVPGDANQLKAAGEVVDKLAAAGFTFKEAMYALDQLFPGLDIGYSLGEQAGTPQGIVRFSADKSYTPLAEKIKGYTGAGGAWQDSQVVQANVNENKPADTNRTDPISVRDGNSRYYFMADDGDGQYEGISDLLGADGNEGMDGFRTKYGIPEGQNIIEGDALNNIMVMKLEEVDNKDGTVSVQQSFMSAADAGITRIDLTPTNEGDSYNINNSQVQTTFNVTMNGDTKVAEQAMEDGDYIDATLNNQAIVGSNMFSQLTEEQINNAFAAPLTGDAQRVYELAERVNTRATQLKQAADAKGGDIDWGGVESETEFRKRIKQELDDAMNLAESKGDELYREYQAEYNKEGDFGGYYNDKNEGLHEMIQNEITEEMQEKGYEDYGKHEEIELKDE